jgi:hypothetical protein
VTLMLEPAEDAYLMGHIASPGDQYPVRLLVQDLSGKKRGYLTRNPILKVGSLDRDSSSVWYLDVYGQQRIQDNLRALVNGDRVAIYGWEKSSCYLVDILTEPLFLQLRLSRPFAQYRRDLFSRETQYRFIFSQRH